MLKRPYKSARGTGDRAAEDGSRVEQGERRYFRCELVVVVRGGVSGDVRGRDEDRPVEDENPGHGH